jgi:hypothetical protein
MVDEVLAENGDPVIFYHGKKDTIKLGYINEGCRLH